MRRKVAVADLIDYKEVFDPNMPFDFDIIMDRQGYRLVDTETKKVEDVSIDELKTRLKSEEIGHLSLKGDEVVEIGLNMDGLPMVSDHMCHDWRDTVLYKLESGGYEVANEGGHIRRVRGAGVLDLRLSNGTVVDREGTEIPNFPPKSIYDDLDGVHIIPTSGEIPLKKRMGARENGVSVKEFIELLKSVSVEDWHDIIVGAIYTAGKQVWDREVGDECIDIKVGNKRISINAVNILDLFRGGFVTGDIEDLAGIVLYTEEGMATDQGIGYSIIHRNYILKKLEDGIRNGEWALEDDTTTLEWLFEVHYDEAVGGRISDGKYVYYTHDEYKVEVGLDYVDRNNVEYDIREIENVYKETKSIDKVNEALKSKDVPYRITEDLDVVVLDRSATQYKLPDFIEMIGDGAFKNCGFLEKIEIPHKVKFIGAEAFSGCTSMTECIIGNNVKIIKEFAFDSCFSLNKIKFGEGLREIRDGAFNDCVTLQDVEFNEGLEVIGNKAFRATYIVNLSLPESIKVLGDEAFLCCLWLEEVHVPRTLETVGKDTFRGCPIVKADIEPGTDREVEEQIMEWVIERD